MVKFLLAIITAELKNIFSNKSIISVMILGPLIYCFLYPQPYTNEVLSNISIGVLDQDNSTLSRELVRHIDATKEMKTEVKLSSMNEAEQLLKSHQINGILVIPFDFEKNVIKGESSPVSFYGDASYVLIYNNAATALNNVVMDMNSNISVNRQIAQGVDAAVAKNGSLPFSPTMIALFNPQAGYATYVLPPVFILILHQLLFIGILLATFFSKKDIAQLSASASNSISPLLQSILFIAGKTFVYLVIYLVMFIFYMIMLACWYHIPNLANNWELFLFAIIFLLTTIAFALAFSAFIKNAEGIFLLMIPISILLFFASGVSWPQELIPSSIIFIANLFPAVPSMAAATKVAEMGASLKLVWPEIANLLLLSVIYFSIAIFSYYRHFHRLQQQYAR
ncbi:ABC transporter permease [Orbus mooreae]|uniref:ABC transporter permease n=1 Tax=Orbus mooreae TaxID=3074107 RepID=UPI00370D7876